MPSAVSKLDPLTKQMIKDWVNEELKMFLNNRDFEDENNIFLISIKHGMPIQQALRITVAAVMVQAVEIDPTDEPPTPPLPPRE